jgi:1,4-alpha-glucan branching enzyme
MRALDGVELWTSAASHALLPLIATDAGLRLQLATGVGSHERRVGSFGGGFWLPECGYEPGLERELAEQGVRAFCVDQTAALGHGSLDQLEPVATEAGPVAVPIDWATVELVWNDVNGYPVHGDYRDYHRRTVHDLRPWDNAGRAYRHAHALELARQHARHFVGQAVERLDAYAADRGRPGLLTCALDTELLGHWWYEGTAWLKAVLDEAPAQGLDLVTVSEGLDRTAAVDRPLAASTWGNRKDLSTWDSPGVAELAFAARRAELRTVAAAAGGGVARPALERAARELLVLQASDWAFMVTRDLAADYPQRRVAAHEAAHTEALAGGADAELRNLAPALELAPLLTP